MLFPALLGIRDMIGNPPVVGIITLQPFIFAEESIGNPTFPWIIPSIFLGHNDRMSTWERIENIIVDLYGRYIMKYCIFPCQEKILQKYFPDVSRTAEQLEYDKSLLIASTDLSSGYPKPVYPNTIFVGPLHVKGNPLPLPKVNYFVFVMRYCNKLIFMFIFLNYVSFSTGITVG